MSHRILIIPFVRMDADQNPNMKINDTTQQQAAYWRSMFVTLASFRRWNPDLRLQVATNAPLPGWVEQQFAGLRIETRIVDFNHRAPQGFSKSFGGSVYLLDVLGDQRPDEDVLLVDPDVVCVRPLDNVWQACTDTCGTLPIETDPDDPNNGLSLSEARAIHMELGGSGLMPSHTGGEFMVIPGVRKAELWGHVDHAWADSIVRFREGRPHMCTEEHVLTYAFSRMETIDLTPFIRRIWTAARVRTVRVGDRDLTAWHLPAEKERGFPLLYAAASDRGSWFWQAPRHEFVQRAGQQVGLWDRRGMRLVRDAFGAVVGGRLAARFNPGRHVS